MNLRGPSVPPMSANAFVKSDAAETPQQCLDTFSNTRTVQRTESTLGCTCFDAFMPEVEPRGYKTAVRGVGIMDSVSTKASTVQFKQSGPDLDETTFERCDRSSGPKAHGGFRTKDANCANLQGILETQKFMESDCPALLRVGSQVIRPDGPILNEKLT